MRSPIIAIVLLALSAPPVVAADDEKLPPIKPIPRLLPPKGIDIGKEEREKLEAELQRVTKLTKDYNKTFADWMPDVWVYLKAVRWALDFDEFYDAKKDVEKAKAALQTAEHRYNVIHQGQPDHDRNRRNPYDDAAAKPGLVVRGYISDIDGSVQPYGLHIPEKLDLTKPVPLLVWLHGRGDKETDLHFIANREKNKGEFAPDWCITLHPYGRGTIGFKFAGEIDVLDAIESVKKRYKIDEDRIALAGFSMGGAGAWHIGAHYADKFCVVHAGAGFVETAKYNRLTPDKYPAWYEQKLWGWYDVPCYTRNLFNVPVIAYSGENDKQIQAAREMEAAFKAEGRELRHIIGSGVEHKYEAKAKEQVLAEIKAAVEKGREKWPKKVSLQTRTAKYGRFGWVSIIALEESWAEARLDVQITEDAVIAVKAQNVRGFVLYHHPLMAAGSTKNVTIQIGTQELKVRPGQFSEDGLVISRHEGSWREGGIERLSDFNAPRPQKGELAGTIDDAFMSPFVVVMPSGPSRDVRVQRWIEFESKHFVERWRALFRGNVRIKRDSEITEDDLKQFNLVLWGDPDSNSMTKFYARSIPLLQWRDSIKLPGFEFPSTSHVPILIHPITEFDFMSKENVMTGRYVVLNSGPTFREGHDRTNSQQTPKLPDWAIIGLDKDPDAFAPGEIKAAGFFDENWKVKKEEEKKSK